MNGTWSFRRKSCPTFLISLLPKYAKWSWNQSGFRPSLCSLVAVAPSLYSPLKGNQAPVFDTDCCWKAGYPLTRFLGWDSHATPTCCSPVSSWRIGAVCTGISGDTAARFSADEGWAPPSETRPCASDWTRSPFTTNVCLRGTGALFLFRAATLASC